MHSNPILSKFMDVVSQDKLVRSIEDSIENIIDVLYALEQEQTVLQKKIEHEQQLVKDMHKKVDACELQMKVLDEQVTRAKKKMEAATTSREYESLKKEFELIAHQRSAYEDELLTVWAAFELAQKNVSNLQKSMDDHSTQLATVCVQKESEKKIQEEKLEQARCELSEKKQGVPEQWLTEFMRMKRTVSDPVVPLENNACSACFEALSALELVELQRKQLSACRGCFRFLFIP